MFIHRNTNCDIGDAVWRADAGVIEKNWLLPVMWTYYNPKGPESEAYLTVGDLECANSKFGKYRYN